MRCREACPVQAPASASRLDTRSQMAFASVATHRPRLTRGRKERNRSGAQRAGATATCRHTARILQWHRGGTARALPLLHGCGCAATAAALLSKQCKFAGQHPCGPYCLPQDNDRALASFRCGKAHSLRYTQGHATWRTLCVLVVSVSDRAFRFLAHVTRQLRWCSPFPT